VLDWMIMKSTTTGEKQTIVGDQVGPWMGWLGWDPLLHRRLGCPSPVSWHLEKSSKSQGKKNSHFFLQPPSTFHENPDFDSDVSMNTGQVTSQNQVHGNCNYFGKSSSRLVEVRLVTTKSFLFGPNGRKPLQRSCSYRLAWWAPRPRFRHHRSHRNYSESMSPSTRLVLEHEHVSLLSNNQLQPYITKLVLVLKKSSLSPKEPSSSGITRKDFFWDFMAFLEQ
jgi:hypothetical protein